MDRPPRARESAEAGGRPPSTVGAHNTAAATIPAPAPAPAPASTHDQSWRTTSPQATSTLTSALQGPHPGRENPADSRAAQAPPSTANANHTFATNTRPKLHRHHTAAATSGRLHARVPSSKTLKHHATPSAKATQRRPHPDEPQTLHVTSRHTHRRAHSDVKLVRDRSTASLKRNQSHDFANRDRSFDKLRGANTAAAQLPIPTEKGGKREEEAVGDNDDDEWVDDSMSASPYPITPREPPPQQPSRPAAAAAPVPKESPRPPPTMSSAEREIAQQHKEYLTSRLLRRIPSHNAPPQMSPTVASAPRIHRLSPDNLSQDSTAPATPNPGSGGEEDGGPDGLTSRFLTRPSSTFGRDGSFYNHEPPPNAGRSLDAEAPGRRHRSMVDLTYEDPASPRDASEEGGGGEASSEQRRGSRRRRAPPAEISRTQQKLNLQRASSGIEPQQPSLAAASSSAMGSEATLVSVSTPGHDGTVGRGDPRLPRLAEKTGMEYRVVRRYQNPLLRSVARLENVPGWDAQRKVPRGGHVRNSSLPPFRDGVGGAGGGVGGGSGLPIGSRPGTPMRPQSSRAVARDGLMGREDIMGARRNGDEGVVAALRNLWEKPLDLSASH